MKKLFLTLILLFSISINGCTSHKPIDIIKDDELGGTGLGLWFNQSDKHQFIHNIDKNQAYNPKITVINNLSNEQRYRVFFILDYKQTNVITDGESFSYIDVSLKSNERKEFEVQLKPMDVGLHDFMVITVRSPNYYLDEKKYIGEDQFFMYRKVNLLVGNSKDAPPIKYKLLKSKLTNLQMVQPLVTQSSTLTDFHQLSNILNTTSDLYGHYISRFAQNFATILLSTEGQIPLDNTFYKMSQPGQVDFPLKIKSNNTKKLIFI